MKNSKRNLLLLRHDIYLSKKMYPDTPEEIQLMSKIPYNSTIRSFMYVMLCTHPDIALAVSVTNRYQANPGKEHRIFVKNIFKYLRRTKDIMLVFDEGLKLKVEGYTDSTIWLMSMIESLHRGVSSCVMVVRLAGRVSSSRSLQIRLWNSSTSLPLKLLRKLFGSKNLLRSWV